MKHSRRNFLKQTATGASLLVAAPFLRSAGARLNPMHMPVGKPLAVASANGLRTVEKAMEMIGAGSDVLDAIISGVNIVEEDPDDTSVGYGGLPNEDGIVELDAAVMHGPTHRAGAVAALRNIKTPSTVARMVMERTDHVLVVGEGALRFARAHGFVEHDLLTEHARAVWLRWKETMSHKDDWISQEEETGGSTNELRHDLEPFLRHYGTLHCSAMDGQGNMSCVTTTSGLSFKIGGRVGDSPIIGAGLYVDNGVGAAGSAGRGEATLVNCSSFLIVEEMRRGKSPEQACLEACIRIVEHTTSRRLRGKDGRPTFHVDFYALNKKGEFGGAGIFSGKSMAVHDGTSARLVPLAYLYKRPEKR